MALRAMGLVRRLAAPVNVGLRTPAVETGTKAQLKERWRPSRVVGELPPQGCDPGGVHAKLRYGGRHASGRPGVTHAGRAAFNDWRAVEVGADGTEWDVSRPARNAAKRKRRAIRQGLHRAGARP